MRLPDMFCRVFPAFPLFPHGVVVDKGTHIVSLLSLDAARTLIDFLCIACGLFIRDFLYGRGQVDS